MRIRLGYACISETLNTNYKTYTYSNYIKKKKKKKLEEIITSNLFHCVHPPIKSLCIYIYTFTITLLLRPISFSG